MSVDQSTHTLLTQVATQGVSSRAWTQGLAREALPEHDVAVLVDRALQKLSDAHVSFPDHDALVRRSVTALLTGHLVLQGPPGTGKTTLARVLAETFRMGLHMSTATTEWSPFHVVGGLRPTQTGGLEPVLGEVPSAVLECATVARAALDASANGGDPESFGTWLLIDEFNRADIDKAIGSLYTLLSSCDPHHLRRTPIDLWFEPEPSNRQLWVPARFRIIGTMNDLDTSYVSPMSQGLRRRFQFITVGVPQTGATIAQPVSVELTEALQAVNEVLDDIYGRPQVSEATAAPSLEKLQRIVDGVRRPADADGWPVGTAQVVDVIKAMLIISPGAASEALDEAIALRLVGQMNTVTKRQYNQFGLLLRREGMKLAARELDHLYRPYTTT